MYEEYDSVRFLFFLLAPPAAFFGAFADCFDGVFAMMLFNYYQMRTLMKGRRELITELTRHELCQQSFGGGRTTWETSLRRFFQSPGYSRFFVCSSTPMHFLAR